MPALAGLVVPFADLGQVAGQIIGAFGGQEAVGLHQAAGEIGAVAIDVQFGHGTRLVQPLPVAFGGHVRRGRAMPKPSRVTRCSTRSGRMPAYRQDRMPPMLWPTRRTCPSGA